MKRIRRRARLFVAGDYPDKGLRFDEQDIEAIVRSFTGPVPVNLHHIHTSLTETFGQLRRIWRRGVELFGELEFSDAVWHWMREAAARFLSVELVREDDGWRLTGVALTDNPRVATAEVFENGCRIAGVVEAVGMQWGGLAYDDILTQIYDILNPDRQQPVWVEDVYEDSVIVSIDGRTYRYPMAVSDGVVILGDPEPVRRAWVPVETNPQAQMENEMSETVTMDAVRSVVAEAVSEAVERAVAAAQERWEARERELEERRSTHIRAREAARQLVESGRIAAGQLDAAAALLERDEDTFRAFLEAAPQPEPQQGAQSELERSIFEALGVSPEYARRGRN